MRHNCRKQLGLVPVAIDHFHAKELERIGKILDENHTITQRAHQDLLRGVRSDCGAPGMSGAQAVRAAIVKQMHGFSYAELAFHLEDSSTFRRFLGLGLGEAAPKRATLQENIRRLHEDTWRSMNVALVRYAAWEGIETGDKSRVDCTVTATHIHDPWDSIQLWDIIRVLTRLMRRARSAGVSFEMHDRTKSGKRRQMEVLNARRKKKRNVAYRRMLRITEEVLGYARACRDELLPTADNHMRKLAGELARFIDLGERVVTQTYRRVVLGERVPSSEKVVSIFEPHTDVVVKEARKVHYGHKLCLAVGASTLVTDCIVLRGNPNDSTLVGLMLDRHVDIFQAAPRQLAMDGGFTSRAGLATAKKLGVKDVCFSKRRGISISDMVDDVRVYRRLRRFRAGVEGIISFLKRCFGLGRCNWRGQDGFDRYVQASVLAYNLLVVARVQLE